MDRDEWAPHHAGHGSGRASNPFSTRFVRAGALPFRFPPGITVIDLIGRMRRQGWWGQIIGPHGSGKSTLLRTLEPELLAAGRTIQWYQWHAGCKRRCMTRARNADEDHRSLVVIDGYEQLSWFERFRWQRYCRRQRWGLLVTAHQDCRLPHLLSTETTIPLAQQLVRQLVPCNDRWAIQDDVVADAFHACNGNLRETWFRLYDVCENRSGAR
jgi:hypothetical protein